MVGLVDICIYLKRRCFFDRFIKCVYVWFGGNILEYLKFNIFIGKLNVIFNLKLLKMGSIFM